MAEPPGIRLQKVLAAAGLGSRRHCEGLIDAGRVAVDGAVVREQGRRVDPAAAVVTVDGTRVVTRTGLVHLAVNKPAGVLTAMSDGRGRPHVGELVQEFGTRLFHVGRLDQDTEGLLIVTNDGELAHRLAHPSFAVAKTYLAEVRGPLPRDALRRLRRGVDLDGRPVAVSQARAVDAVGARVLVELTLHEGRRHVVRRLLAEVGAPVRALARTRVGPVQLGTLPSGRARHLTSGEVGALYVLVGL
jgi:23S rRNA pseudouridine2605 synthase